MFSFVFVAVFKSTGFFYFWFPLVNELTSFVIVLFNPIVRCTRLAGYLIVFKCPCGYYIIVTLVN